MTRAKRAVAPAPAPRPYGPVGPSARPYLRPVTLRSLIPVRPAPIGKTRHHRAPGLGLLPRATSGQHRTAAGRRKRLRATKGKAGRTASTRERDTWA